MTFDSTAALSLELVRAARLLISKDTLPILSNGLLDLSLSITNGPAYNPFPELDELVVGLETAGYPKLAAEIRQAIADYRNEDGKQWEPSWDISKLSDW